MWFGIDRKEVVKKGPARSNVNVQFRSSPAATAEEARRVLAQLDCLMRTRSAGTAGGPAEMYRMIGTFAQISEILPSSLRRIGDVLADQYAQGRLAIEDGPFAGDTPAAIAVTKQALDQAASACDDLYAALERAQLATAEAAAPMGRAGRTRQPRTRQPRTRQPRTSKGRLLTRHRRWPLKRITVGG